ncbi:hypothetical protein PS2_018550 [Malus domestica]
MEASEVKSNKSSGKIEKVSKPRAQPFHLSTAHPPRADQHGCSVSHPLSSSDFQYALKFLHLGFKPIDDSLEVDHLVICSNQLFILCSKTKLRNDMLKILNLRYVTSDLLLCTFMLNLDRIKPSLQVNDLLASGLKL